MRRFSPVNHYRVYVPLILTCISSLILYLKLIYLYPNVYWYDPHIRLALRNQLLPGHWLPLIQSLIAIVSRISVNLMLLRSILAVLAVGTVVAMFFFTRQLFSDLTAVIAAMFLAFDMMFVALAIVPYPEVIFVGLCLAGFVLLDGPIFSPSFYFGVLALNLACLTRYEGWIVSALFMLEISFRLFLALKWRRAFWSIIKVLGLLSTGPAFWLFWGFPGSGNIVDRLRSIVAFEVSTSMPQVSSHLSARLNFVHVQEFSSQYFDLLIQQFHPGFLVVSVIGILLIFLNRPLNLSHLRILLFLLLDWFLLAFFQPWEFGNLRQPFVLQVFLIPYAAHGFVQSVSWLLSRSSDLLRWKKILDLNGIIISLTSLIISVWLAGSAFKFVAATSYATDFRGPFEVANWLDQRIKTDDSILVIDDKDEYYPYALAAYSSYPVEDILSDRFDSNLVQEKLNSSSHMVYVIEFYSSAERLTPAELHVVEDLENGRIHGDHFLVDKIRIWYVNANRLVYKP